MKKLQIIAWALFSLGFIFRLLHYPGTAIISLIGTLLLLIHSIIYLSKNAKTNLPTSFLHLSFSLLTTYILFRFQYWSFGPMIFGLSPLFIISFLVTLTCFILHFTKKTPLKFPQLFLLLYFAFFMILSFTHADKVYYFFNLNTVLNSGSRNTNYYCWDKYSWFLYIAHKQDEAILANRNAQNAAIEYLKIVQDENAVHYLALIKQHEQQIQHNSWTTYP
jgi:hypothetical protein